MQENKVSKTYGGPSALRYPALNPILGKEVLLKKRKKEKEKKKGKDVTDKNIQCYSGLLNGHQDPLNQHTLQTRP